MIDDLQKDLVTAMKSGDSRKVSVLRMLLSEINYKKIELQRDLTDADVTGVVQKEIKKRREAIETYEKANRPELAGEEKQEMELLTGYVPAQMGEAEIKAEVMKLLETVPADARGDFGKVMRVVAPAFRGKADGSVVAGIVKELL